MCSASLSNAENGTRRPKWSRLISVNFEILIWCTRLAAAYEQSRTEANRKVAVDTCGAWSAPSNPAASAARRLVASRVSLEVSQAA